MNIKALEALTVPEEFKEALVIGKKPVKLKRTFNQSDFKGGFIKFWRVVGPVGHKNYESDLSLDGLIEWGIISQQRLVAAPKETI